MGSATCQLGDLGPFCQLQVPPLQNGNNHGMCFVEIYKD